MPSEQVRQAPIRLSATALVLNDMVNAGLRKPDDPEHNRRIAESGFIENTVRVVADARQREMPIFWIRVERRADRADVVQNLTDHPIGWHLPEPITRESPRAEQLDELPVLPGDQVILKPRFDPFIGTDLDLQLRARRIDTILLGGYSTNVGVESCARTAHDLGYNVVLLRDCCFNVDRELHEFAVRSVLPRFARVMTSVEAMSLIE